MTLPGTDKWGTTAQFEVVEFFHSRMRDRFADRVRKTGKRWEEVVYDPVVALTREDLEEIERELLDTGYRYEYSAQISLVEDPDKYRVTAEGGGGDEQLLVAEAGEAHEEAGRTVVGTGANVTRKPATLTGTARFISTTEKVMDMVLDGVPEETIAVIDDAGGTLTAPIIEGFSGIICLGGTVRSHLAILAREFDLPCLMDAQPEGLRDGDRVEVEYTAPPPATSAETGVVETQRAHIWKVS